MTTKEILIAAKKKIEQGWTQGMFARTETGVKAVVRGDGDHKPVCWCSEGAIYEVCGFIDSGACRRLREAIGGRALEVDGLVRWNDTPGRTQAEVISAFERAIAMTSR